MSKVNGRLLTCDRCGTQVFLKYIGDGERDGGYTRWNKFEDKPEGWGMADNMDLCPDCCSEFNRLRDEFMTKKRDFLRRGVNDSVS